jgi:hypothetical protein
MLRWILTGSAAAFVVLAVMFTSARNERQANDAAHLAQWTAARKEIGRLRDELGALQQLEKTRAAAQAESERAWQEADRARAEKAARDLAARRGEELRAKLLAQRDAATDQIRAAPEYAGYLVRNARLRVLRRFGAALEALQLEPDKLEKLKQLLTEREMSSVDAQILARLQGEPMNGPTATQLRQKISRESDTQLRELLGDNGYKEFNQRLDFQSDREVMFDYCNTLLAERGVPLLTEAQMLECYRAHRSAPANLRFPMERAQWDAAMRSRISVASLTPEQENTLLEHTFAYARKSWLGFEARRKMMNPQE